MPNFFSKILNKRKKSRIGSRPIDYTQPSTSRARNPEMVNRLYPPIITTEEDMQDLQKIVGDFERAYASPKPIRERPRSGNFVKRMVAALEQKYNSRRESRRNTPKSKRNCVNATEEFRIRHVPTKTTTPLNKTFVIKPRCRSVDRLPDSEDPFPYVVDQDRTDITEYTFEIDEGPSKSKNTPSDRNDRVIRVDKRNTAVSREKSNTPAKKEKTPKIIGAFLKKPIEVEETEINWIPITNQKLPRRTSFQKLVSILTGKKSANRACKLQHPENEKIPERRDSGHVETTSNNSQSACQYTKVVNHQKTAPVSSFQSSPEPKNNAASTSAAIIKPKKEAYPTLEDLAKKLMLNEVPRSDVRLSLGPFFPASSKANKFICQESTLEETEEEIDLDNHGEIDLSIFVPPLPKHPFVTPLPKHPYISESVRFRALSVSPDHSMSVENPESIMTFEEVSEVDLSDLPSDERPSSKIIDSAPRSSLSISTPNIGLESGNITDNSKYSDDDSYALPPPIKRRKSCIYEDAISLKRRSAFLKSTSDAPLNFYASPDEEQFATVKPRNNKLLPSQELLRSLADNEYQLQSPYLVNHLSHFNLVF